MCETVIGGFMHKILLTVYKKFHVTLPGLKNLLSGQSYHEHKKECTVKLGPMYKMNLRNTLFIGQTFT